jgi:hypothetical protein
MRLEMPMLDDSASDAVRTYMRMGLDQAQEEREINAAERAQRLAAFFDSDVWQLDIAPILTKLYDDYLEAVKSKTVDPDGLKVLDDLVVRLGGSLQLGVGAMRRIAKRRLEATEKMAETQRTRRTPAGQQY